MSAEEAEILAWREAELQREYDRAIQEDHEREQQR